jgi:hypothetical protein
MFSFSLLLLFTYCSNYSKDAASATVIKTYPLIIASVQIGNKHCDKFLKINLLLINE